MIRNELQAVARKLQKSMPLPGVGTSLSRTTRIDGSGRSFINLLLLKPIYIYILALNNVTKHNCRVGNNFI